MSEAAFESVAGCMGDRTRAAMLDALMDGRAHTATELAVEGDVSPSTASTHLARLVDGGLVEVIKQGRHRYFRLASADVAQALEQLMSLAASTAGPRRGPSDPRLRRARVCYDHLAGELAVRTFARLRAEAFIIGHDFDFALTDRGHRWCQEIGLSVLVEPTVVTGLNGRTHQRPLCRSCLDWSERRPHLAGGLGAALLDRLKSLGFAERALDTRAIEVSPAGVRFLETLELPRQMRSARSRAR